MYVFRYADWCGPCKQLGPQLEAAAIKSKGMFKLAKINSDKNRDIVETLGVTGLPTVFAFSEGRLTDRLALNATLYATLHSLSTAR